MSDKNSAMTKSPGRREGREGISGHSISAGFCGSTFKNIFQNLWSAAEVKVEYEVRHLTGTKFVLNLLHNQKTKWNKD